MSPKTNKEAIEMNIDTYLKMISTMKQFSEATMKLRLEIAEMQLKVLSLYEAPSLQLLQLLINVPGSCQTNDSTENNDNNMQISNENH